MALPVTSDAKREIGGLLWQVYSDLAEAVFALGDLRQATEMLLVAAEEAERLGRNDERLAETLNKLGVLFYYERKYGPAKALVESALGIMQRAEADRLSTAKLLYNLAGIYDADGDRVKAEQVCTTACEILDGVRDREPELAITLLKLGELHLAQERPLQAIFALRRSLGILEAHHIEDWVLATVLTRIGDFYVIEKRPSEAEPFYWRALEVKKELFGEDPAIVKTLDRIIGVYCRQRKFSQAQLLETWSLSLLEGAFGQKHPNVLARVIPMASTLRAQGKLGEARDLLEASLPDLEKQLGKNDLGLAEILEHYAEVLRILREPEAAAEYTTRAHRIRRSASRQGQAFPDDSDVGARIAALVASATQPAEEHAHG
jgi:hypothetical protein